MERAHRAVFHQSLARRRIAHSSLRWALRNPMVLAMIRLDPLVLLAVGHEPVREAMTAFQARLERRLRDAIKTGELRGDFDVPRVAEMLRILHHSFLEPLVEPGWIMTSDDSLIDATFDVVLRGLEPVSH